MDVTIVGSIVIDLISYVEEFPVVGETVFGYQFQKGFGGKGANQCVMARLLGANTAVIGKVGDDVFGNEYIERFKDLSVNTDHLTICKSSSTGTASITVRKKDGANEIVIYPGANFEVSVEDVEMARKLISDSKVILCQMEIPIESTYHALKIAKENNVFIIFNPAPIPHSGIQLSKMPYVDVFCPNESEAAVLTNIAIKDVKDAFEAIKFFFKHHSDQIKWPMITLGHLGVVFGDSQTHEIHHEPAPVVKSVDSTGAGDCFTGSLAYYFATHPQMSIKEKVKRSIQLASSSVQKPGTQASFPTNASLIEL